VYPSGGLFLSFDLFPFIGPHFSEHSNCFLLGCKFPCFFIRQVLFVIDPAVGRLSANWPALLSLDRGYHAARRHLGVLSNSHYPMFHAIVKFHHACTLPYVHQLLEAPKFIRPSSRAATNTNINGKAVMVRRLYIHSNQNMTIPVERSERTCKHRSYTRLKLRLRRGNNEHYHQRGNNQRTCHQREQKHTPPTSRKLPLQQPCLRFIVPICPEQ